MTFAWPWLLTTLVLVPLLVLGYRTLLRSRAGRRADLAALGLVAPSSVTSGVRRHVPPVLFLTAMALLCLATARPQTTIAEPRREGTVVLAFDTSSSMAATDLAPTRMEAAKAAARTFVEKQPAEVKVGVVAFGDNGVIVQRPTTDKAAVVAAIGRVAPQGGTSLGRGIQTSLSAIIGKTVELDPATGGVEVQGQDLGFYGKTAVILLSDGENTSGPDPIELAAMASTAGVKIYPIGLGSPQGTVLSIDGFQVATALDEPTLQEIAKTSDGTYFNAADTESLTKVYDSIDLQWVVQAKFMEVSGLFAGAAVLLLLVGAGLSLAWFGRVI